MTGSADSAAVAWARRPGILCLAAVLFAGGGSAAAATAVKRRSRLPSVRDLLHHRLLPTLQAAERALTAGDVDAATRHLRTAVVLSRTALDPLGTPPEPVLDAIEEARQVWASGLLIDDEGVKALPPRLPATTRGALHAITLESLANVVRHSATPAARVATGTERGYVALTVAANGPPRVASDKTLSTPVAPTGERPGGYGLPSLHRIAGEAGGFLEASFDEHGSIVVARLPSRRAWRRR